ncbi:hypothetical protein DPEC_G00152820 [Dallia pectoralis]|uniref:Uncharacterized protein n=1 Tax=Dallia pectoralis TaxID=75939 RepID=A0ACC2GK92_DALPE|nr:hypothetical protein DPEC_G00152820 [Dallia pectoralis]
MSLCASVADNSDLLKKNVRNVQMLRFTSKEKVRNVHGKAVIQGPNNTAKLGVRAHGRDIDGLAEAFTGYLNFCTDLSIPTKTTRCFSNNKPWITRDIKHLLNRKKRAILAGDGEESRVLVLSESIAKSARLLVLVSPLLFLR